MLIYHFGSKEALLVEVIRAVEEQQRAAARRVRHRSVALPQPRSSAACGDTSPTPALWPNERLFFEMYGQALQGRPHTAEFLDDIVESWLEPIAALRREQGVPARVARAQARLDLAVDAWPAARPPRDR